MALLWQSSKAGVPKLPPPHPWTGSNYSLSCLPCLHPQPQSMEKLSFTKPVLGAKKVGDRCSKVFKSDGQPTLSAIT